MNARAERLSLIDTDESVYATIREICEALGRDRTTVLRRAAKEKWAFEEQPREGGGVIYQYRVADLPPDVRAAVSEARLRVLVPRRSPVSASSTPAPLTSWGRERLDDRLAVTERYLAFERMSGRKRDAAIRAFVELYNAGQVAVSFEVRAKHPTVSPSSLRRWAAAAETGEIRALAGRYGNRSGSSVWDNELRDVREFVLAAATRFPDWSCAQLRRLTGAEYGDPVELTGPNDARLTLPLPPLRSIQKLIADWKEANPSLHRRIVDPDGFKNKDMLALGDASAGITAPNDVWMIDASPTDVVATDGRNQIYLLIDVYTRDILVLVTRTPRTEAVKLLLRVALLSWGVPRTLVTDNGSDFTSKEARRVFAALGIAHDPATPFSPWEKPFVERAIGTLQHGLFPMMPGYCGHNVAEAQRIRARKTFSARMGESDAAAFEVALSAAEIQAHVTRWVRDVYSNTPHRGLGGKTPAQVEAESRDTVRRVIDDERALDMLLVRARGERRVGKKGMRVGRRHYWADALIPWVGKAEPLEARMDPDDPSRVHVYRIDPPVFVATARCLEMMAPSERAEVAVLARRSQIKALGEQSRAITRRARPIDRTQALEAVLNAAAKTVRPIAPPAPTMSHTTPDLMIAGDAARMALPAPAKPLSDAQNVIRLAPPRAPAPPDDQERWWARARDIETRLAAGDPVTPDDAAWLEKFKTTPTYRVRARLAALAG